MTSSLTYFTLAVVSNRLAFSDRRECLAITSAFKISVKRTGLYQTRDQTTARQSSASRLREPVRANLFILLRLSLLITENIQRMYIYTLCSIYGRCVYPSLYGREAI